jgi:hypothetical protein
VRGRTTFTEHADRRAHETEATISTAGRYSVASIGDGVRLPSIAPERSASMPILRILASIHRSVITAWAVVTKNHRLTPEAFDLNPDHPPGMHHQESSRRANLWRRTALDLLGADLEGLDVGTVRRSLARRACTVTVALRKRK